MENYTVAYSYDANNRLTQDVKTVGSAVTTGNYFYDQNGNQLARVSETLTPTGSATSQVGIDSSGVELYEYDGRNRQVYSNVNGETVFYTYRADGLRNSKETAAGKTTHLWDGANIVADMNGSAVIARYVRGVGLLLSDSDAGQKFYLFNAHGDVVQLTSNAGAILWQYDYDSFGNEREIAGQDASLDENPFRYCGEYYGLETNNYYLRARYFNPIIGRFLAEDSHWYPSNNIYGDNPVKINQRQDPLGLNTYTLVPDITAIMQSGNLYNYCMNNPIMYVDSSGEFVIRAPLKTSFTTLPN